MIANENLVFPVYLEENVLKSIMLLCKRSAIEVFGYLVGEVLSWNNEKYVVIGNHLFIQAATHSQQFSVSQIDDQ